MGKIVLIAFTVLISALVSDAAWKLEAVGGCIYSPYLSGVWGSTLGCNPEGGQTLILYGDWSDQQEKSKITVTFVDKLVEGAVKCSEEWIGVPGAEGSTRTTKCVKDELFCTDVAVISTTQISCKTPAGAGLYWIPVVTDLGAQQVAELTDYAYPNVTLSYLTGGYALLKEGVGRRIGFMSGAINDPNSGPLSNVDSRTWRLGSTQGSSTSVFNLAGIQKQQAAAPNSEGTLDSSMWRVTGIDGRQDGSAGTCYQLAAHSDMPQSDFRVGDCGTFWGYGTPFLRPTWSYLDVYNDMKRVFTPDGGTIGTADTFPATGQQSGNPSWSSTATTFQGGLVHMKVGTSVGGLGFVPFKHSVAKRDFMPGYIDFRMVNEMEQTISALAVRYSLQCRNMFMNTTTVTLGYTHHGGDNWYFNMLPSTTLTTDAQCDTAASGCKIECATQNSSCWDNNKFVDTEITGLDWRAGQNFFLRWAIDSDASTMDFGDPCRITDLEIIPYVYDYGSTDRSMKFMREGESFVRFNATVPMQSNYTFEMTIWPEQFAFPAADASTGIPRDTINTEMVLLSSYDAISGSKFVYKLEYDDQVAMPQYLKLVEIYPLMRTLWTGTVAVPFNQWTHLAIVHEFDHAGHYLRVYFDGALVEEAHVPDGVPGLGAQNQTMTEAAGSSIIIGQHHSGTGSFVGLIDEFRVWTSMRTAAEIHENKDNELVDAAHPDLLVYLKFNRMLSSPARIPNEVPGSLTVAELPGSSPVLSTITPNTLLTLTGGAISCPEKYVVPNSRVTCNFTVFDQWGRAVPTFNHDEFRVRVISGEGVIGPLDPDWTGVSWTFTYFSTNATGTAHVQAFTKHGDAFVGAPVKITTISEGCRGCEWREDIPDGGIGTYKIYSCQVGGRRFIRKDILPTEGTCPMP
mmetsp:Transcript_163/g.428  ORF Transcript_163/g.428 Transcript_163/m.428 type:complete len:907 (-) Transcript_163:326-3046(-)